mgnify:CR=1 FL=1
MEGMQMRYGEDNDPNEVEDAEECYEDYKNEEDGDRLILKSGACIRITRVKDVEAMRPKSEEPTVKEAQSIENDVVHENATHHNIVTHLYLVHAPICDHRLRVEPLAKESIKVSLKVSTGIL